MFEAMLEQVIEAMFVARQSNGLQAATKEPSGFLAWNFLGIPIIFLCFSSDAPRYTAMHLVALSANGLTLIHLPYFRGH